MEQYIEKNGIPYKLGEDGLYYPQFELFKDDEAHYDKYGRMRYRYLKEHRELLFVQLVMEGKLNRHLNEVDDTANARMELLIRQMAKQQGVEEDLKERDQLGWVRAMTNIHACAEEIVLAEVVYA